MKDQKTPKNSLGTMFPQEKISFGEGDEKITITVKPVPLSSLPLVIKSMTKLGSLVESGTSQHQIFLEAASEVLSILPHCIDVPLNQLPNYAAAEILPIVIDQNLNEDVLGKWKALIQKSTNLIGMDQGETTENT